MQPIKIKLSSHSEFLQARDSLLQLGYRWGGDGGEPYTAPYIFAHGDGRIFVEYFDVKDADLTSPNSAYGYFVNHPNTEITLSQLASMAYEHKLTGGRVS